MSRRIHLCALLASISLALLAIAALASPPDREALRAELAQLAPLEQEAAVKARWYSQLLTEDPQRTENMDDYDVLRYDLDLTVDPTAQLLTGLATVEARVVAAELSLLDVHFSDNMAVASVTAGGMTAVFNHADDILTTTLDRTYVTGETVTIVISYSGNPEGTGLAFNWDAVGGTSLVWTMSCPYGAREWWPCKDLISDKAETVDLHVRVPEGFVVASNGTLVAEESDPPHRVFHWHEGHAIATYLVSIAIHPYVVVSNWYHPAAGDSMEVRNYIVPENLDQATAAFAVTPTIIGAYAESFGEYPFIDEKYGHAQFGWYGAMEHQTCTSVSTDVYDESIIAHELSHQWFGDLVTCADWHHAWLNEGWATWAQAHWAELSQGTAAYHDFMNTHSYAGAGTVYVEDATYFGVIFDYNLTYLKAGWVVHMLRYVVGDEDFFDGLHVYLERYADTSATTEQFQAVMEEVSGRDLDAFFQQWIYGEYFPRYRFAWSDNSSAGSDEHRVVILRIDQIQTNTGLFEMPLDVQIVSDSGSWDYRIENALQTEYYDFLVPGHTITDLQLDPDNWVMNAAIWLGEVAVDDVASPASLWLSGHPNPFNPVTTIDFELASEEFVRLEVYDLAGRRVRELLAEPRATGRHSVVWDGRSCEGRELPSGTYVARMSVDGAVANLKLTLAR